MKKLLLLAISGMFLMSCGGGASVCKCNEWEMESDKEKDALMEKYYNEEISEEELEEAREEWEDKWDPKKEECEKLAEDMDREELMKKLEDC